MVSQPYITKEALGRLRMPVLVVAGEKDMILEEHTRAIGRALLWGKVKILPGTILSPEKTAPRSTRPYWNF